MLRICAALTLTLAASYSHASDGCAHAADRSARLDTQGVRSIVITAGAGDLKIRGSDTNALAATGRACASNEELLSGIQLDTRREGDTLHLTARTPETDGNLLTLSRYARMNLDVSLPNSIAIEVNDGSGDTEIANVASARVTDGSGDLEIKHVSGDLDVTDSSGELEIEHVDGNVTVRDSSGDLEIDHVRGAVLIEVDSSGDIHIAEVGSVHIRNDSSGEIVAQRVKGDVTIDNDSSGDIRVEDVAGNFTVGADGTGSIRHERVGGRVQIPQR